MNKLFLLSAITLAALWSFNANAADSASGTAQVEIVQPMGITHSDSDKLNFASVYAKDGNNVTVSTAGARTAGKGFGTTSADHFSITGPSGGSATITIPASATMTRSGGSETISVTLTPSVTSGSTVEPGDTIDVGGSIAVTSATAEGSYSGTYTVSIAY